MEKTKEKSAIQSYVDRVVETGCTLPRKYIQEKYPVLEDFGIAETEIHWAHHRNIYSCDREFRTVIMQKLA